MVVVPSSLSSLTHCRIICRSCAIWLSHNLLKQSKCLFVCSVSQHDYSQHIWSWLSVESSSCPKASWQGWFSDSLQKLRKSALRSSLRAKTGRSNSPWGVAIYGCFLLNIPQKTNSSGKSKNAAVGMRELGGEIRGIGSVNLQRYSLTRKKIRFINKSQDGRPRSTLCWVTQRIRKPLGWLSPI